MPLDLEDFYKMRLLCIPSKSSKSEIRMQCLFGVKHVLLLLNLRTLTTAEKGIA